MPWMLNGKEISDEEYKELLRRQTRGREQASALLRQLTDSYRELTEFMRENPGIVQPVNSDAEQMQQALYQKLRQNLQQANQSPRCCWIKEDGMPCRSPKMRTHDYCFAHMQMYETMPKKFRLPAAEDANGIQLAIMQVQRALIDDEISEKKAGLLLYSLQIASANLERTTFGENPGEMVTDCVEEEPEDTRKREEQQISPLMNTDEEMLTEESRRRGENQTPTTEARKHGERQIGSGMNADDTHFEQPEKMLPQGELSNALQQTQIASGA